MRLAGLYIQNEVKKPKEAETILEQVEANNKDDKDKLGKIWSLRIKALTAQGRGREAVDILVKQADIATPETFVNVGGQMTRTHREKMRANDKDPTINEDLKTRGDALRSGGRQGRQPPSPRSSTSASSASDCSASARASPASATSSGSWRSIRRCRSPRSRRSSTPARRSSCAGAATELDLDRQRAIAFAVGRDRQLARRRLGSEGGRRQAPALHGEGHAEQGGRREVPAASGRLPGPRGRLHPARPKGEKAHYESAEQILVQPHPQFRSEVEAVLGGALSSPSRARRRPRTSRSSTRLSTASRGSLPTQTEQVRDQDEDRRDPRLRREDHRSSETQRDRTDALQPRRDRDSASVSSSERSRPPRTPSRSRTARPSRARSRMPTSAASSSRSRAAAARRRSR